MNLRTLVDAVAERPGLANPHLSTGRLCRSGLATQQQIGLVLRDVASSSVVNEVVVAMSRRQRRLADDLARGGRPTISFRLATASRLITRSGDTSPEVNSTRVHPVWGIPVLPGSSLKGAARAAAHWAGASPADVERIFGPPPPARPGVRPGDGDAAGTVIFLDAYPHGNGSVFDVDVATPHHQAYYSGERPDPAPIEGPNPLTLLVVPADRPFRFTLAARAARSVDDVAAAARFLKGALTDEGFGSATSSGYGYFRSVPGTDVGPKDWERR